MPWGEFKDTAAERRLFQRRSLVMLVLVMLAIGGLIARMYQLQVVEHEIYTTLSDKNRVQVQSVPPPRGWYTTAITPCWRRTAPFSV